MYLRPDDFETKVVNLTDDQIDFKVARGKCLLLSLAAGETGSVNLSKLRKLNRKRETPHLEILINHQFSGKTLDYRKHLLKMSLIEFRFESLELTAKGIQETLGNRFVPYFINWDNKIRTGLDLDAKSRKKTEARGNPNIVVAPLIGPENNQQLREVEHPHNLVPPLIGPENSPQSREREAASAERVRDLHVLADHRRRDHVVLADLQRMEYDELNDFLRQERDILADFWRKEHDILADLTGSGHDMLADLRRMDHDMLADLRRRDHDKLADLRRRDHEKLAELRRRDQYGMLVGLRRKDTFSTFFFFLFASIFVALLWLRYKT